MAGIKKHAKITAKGQITVPSAIRKALGVRAGDVLLFEEDKTGVRVRPVKSKKPIRQVPGHWQPANRFWKKGNPTLDARDARMIQVRVLAKWCGAESLLSTSLIILANQPVNSSSIPRYDIATMDIMTK